MKGVVFVDAGNAYGGDEDISLDNTRASAGGGVRWLSPLGPLRVELGLPIKDKARDQKSLVLFRSAARSSSDYQRVRSHMANRSVRWGRTLALASLVGLLIASTAAAEMRVAVVDMQRALNECDAGKRAKDQVKSKFERAQDQLKKQRESLDARREDYEKKATVMREEERRDLEKDLEGDTLEFSAVRKTFSAISSAPIRSSRRASSRSSTAS